MAATFIPYQHMSRLAWRGALDWEGNSIYCALVTASYVPSTTHTQWSDVSANEVANGNGYTTGGLLLTGKSVTNTMADCDNPVFSSLTKTFRYVVFYRLGTIIGLTDPLIGYLNYGDTVTVNGVPFTVTIPSTGLVALSQNTN